MVLNPLYLLIKSQLLKMKCVFQHQVLRFWSTINISNFHPLEVVGRGSQTQLQVGEKLNVTMYSVSLSRIKYIFFNFLNIPSLFNIFHLDLSP